MKYGIITHEGRNLQENEQLLINVGNYMQWIAIENLYAYMGIKKQDIVKLTTEELKTYRGEKIILPLNYMLTDTAICAYTTDEGNFIFSQDIEPVFLGISLKKGYWKWTEDNIGYFKKHEPIGCRDYQTYEAMLQHGIKAYLAGCLTATLPLEESRTGVMPKYTRVFFVEVPKSLEKYVPRELYEDCEFIQQEIRITEEEFYDKNYGMQYTRNLLQKYRENARLIITSRLHCAIPCMAIGIPVILVKEYFGYPFDLQKKFLPCYSYANFNKIDWEPKRTELEEYKIIALECARRRLLNEDAEAGIEKLHNQYKSLYLDGYRDEQMSMDMFKQSMAERYDTKQQFNYAIWGLGNYAEWIYNYMTRVYPNAKLVRIIDTFKKEEFHGISAELPDELTANDDFVTIVSTINCAAAANVFFEKIGKPSEQYICVADGIMKEPPKNVKERI